MSEVPLHRYRLVRTDSVTGPICLCFRTSSASEGTTLPGAWRCAERVDSGLIRLRFRLRMVGPTVVGIKVLRTPEDTRL